MNGNDGDIELQPRRNADVEGVDNRAFSKKDDSSAWLTEVESEAQLNDPGAAKENESTLLVLQNRVVEFYKRQDIVIITAIKAFIILLYFGYFAYALKVDYGNSEGSYRLFVVTILVVFFMVMSQVFKFKNGALPHAITTTWQTIPPIIVRWFYYILTVAFGIFAFLYVIIEVVRHTPKSGIPIAGLAGFILLFYVFSKNPAKVKWRPVIWGLYIQFIFACIILRWDFGYEAFKWIGDRVYEFLTYSDAGAVFVFGNKYTDHFFAFKVLPVIIFFSTAVSMLYYMGVMQFLISVIARGIALCMGTSPAESLNAAGNIFIGQSEAPLLIRPMIKDLTKSEIHAVMTGGFATIAGSVMAAYILYGVPAHHLFAASVMSAPAALAMSKLFYPETEVENTTNQTYTMEDDGNRNIIDAASNGAVASVKLVANVAVNLIAFLAILAFVNATLEWFGTRVSLVNPPLTFELICSYILYPMAFMMGSDAVDSRNVAELIGVKTFLNEFVAYERLSVFINNRKKLLEYIEGKYSNYVCSTPDNIYLPATNVTLTGGLMTARSEIVATYALCGFANIGSMGILLGSLGAMAPSRKADLAKVVFRALLAGNVACFMTACIAGVLIKADVEPLDQMLMTGKLCPPLF